MIPGAATQVRALLALRWQMVRAPGARFAMCLGILAVLYLLVEVAQLAGGAVEPAALETARRVAPQAFLGFGLLAVIAPLTAGGGNEIVPPDRLVAFPVRPRTQFAGGLVLAPVNLVWVLQIFALVTVTALLTNGGRTWPGALTTASYIAAITALGQAFAWTVAGLRQSSRGRRSVVLAGSVLVAAVLTVVKTGAGPAVLAASPTRLIARAILAGARGDWLRWATTTGGLLLLLTLSLLAGSQTCAWVLRRPVDAGASRTGSGVRRRPTDRSALRTLIAVDRASAWRAAALKRGAIVLAVLPGIVAAGAAVPWESMIVLPGLVAAGAGLLFGVNAFCLDASGAVWLASLPHDPALLFRSKTWVLAETVIAGVGIAVVAGSLRSPGLPSPAEVVAIAVSAITCTAVVLASCMSLSVRHPHYAELHGPRDAVAPPGALTLASARLALPAGLVGVALEGASQTGRWEFPVLLAVPVAALCVLSLRRSARRWADPLARAGIVQVVSAG